MPELRKTPRVGPLVIRAEFYRGDSLAHGYLTSLGEGGAFLATGEPLAVGQTVILRAALPWKLGQLDTEADVVWEAKKTPGSAHLPTGVGLAFRRLSPEERESIRAYTRKFHQLVAQIEEEGLEQALSRLTRDVHSA